MTSSKKQFAIIFREHRRWGSIATPYFLTESNDTGFYTLDSQIKKENLKNSEYEFSKAKIEAVSIIDEYNDHMLMKLFSKEKNLQAFYKAITPERIEEHIRPYIERKIIGLIDKLVKSNLPVYYLKKGYDSIYSSNRIKIHEKPAETIFNFNKTEDGTTYFLSVRHGQKIMKINGQVGTIICNSPCRLLLNNDLFIFDDIDGGKLKPFFVRQLVSIPKKSEEKYFSTFVLNAIKKYRVNATGFDIIDDTPPKKAILTLEKDWEDEPVLLLKFAYGKKEYLPNEKTELTVKFKAEDDNFTFNKIARNIYWEQNCISELVDLQLTKSHEYFRLPKKTKKEDKEEQKNRLVNWLNKHKETLESQGFFF